MHTGHLVRRIVPVVSVMLALAGCGKTDECLTNVDPLPAANGAITHLGQCWTRDEIVRFYTTGIGTQLVPYKLVMPLELAKPDKTDPKKLVFTGERFFTRSHIEERWRFLTLELSEVDEQSDVHRSDVSSRDDPTVGWPLGFVVDKRDDNMSGRPEWRGEWLGPTCAACHTGQVEAADRNGRTWKIRIPGAPDLADVNLFLQDLKNSLKAVHEDGVKGGSAFAQYVKRYADRFGAEDEKKILEQLKEAVDDRTGWHARNDPPGDIPHGNGRLDAFGEIYNEIIHMTGTKPVGAILTDAPVSIPFLWDFPYHNLVQWNGAAPVVPLAFNVAGALAIFAKYDPDAGWFQDPSTIRFGKLREMQGLLNRLRSPKWPGHILGTIDKDRAAAGEKLYRDKCLVCHAIQERDQPQKFLKAVMARIDANTVIDGQVTLPVETESRMAENASRAELTDSEGTKVAASKKLVHATTDIIFSSHHPGEIAVLFGEGLSAVFTWWRDLAPPGGDAYKARPLDGIWATAPYLHNGSVPNLYELLLPQAKRTKQFCVGSREFDSERAGFVMLTEAQCMANGRHWLDTNKDGNRNVGHEGPGYDMPTEKQARELVEYLKTL
jgi:cytochrome c5